MIKEEKMSICFPERNTSNGKKEERNFSLLTKTDRIKRKGEKLFIHLRKMIQNIRESSKLFRRVLLLRN